MFRGDLSGKPLYDAAIEAQNLVGQPTPTGFDRANSFLCPLGKAPGHGWIILRRRDMNALNLNGLHILTLQLDPEVGATQTQRFRNLVICKEPVNLDPGLGANDPDSVYLVEVADARWRCQNPTFKIALDKAYNVRAQAYQSDSYSYSLNTGVAWTWATMLADIWSVLTPLGAWPGLPAGVTPASAPDGWEFRGVSAYDALNIILARIGCALRADLSLTTGQFSIVQVGAVDTAADQALARAAGRKIHDGEYLDIVRGKTPYGVRVFFHRREKNYGTEQTTPSGSGQWQGNAVYHVDITGPVSSTAEASTWQPLWSDLPAIYDDAGAITNAAACSASAQELSDNFYRMLRSSGGLRLWHRYSGLLNLTAGSDLKGVAWVVNELGIYTEVIRHPFLFLEPTDAGWVEHFEDATKLHSPDFRPSWPNYPHLLQTIKLNAATVDGSNRYDVLVQQSQPDSLGWADKEAAYALNLRGTPTLTSGNRYLARLIGYSGGRPLYSFDSASGLSPSSLGFARITGRNALALDYLGQNPAPVAYTGVLVTSRGQTYTQPLWADTQGTWDTLLYEESGNIYVYTDGTITVEVLTDAAGRNFFNFGGEPPIYGTLISQGDPTVNLYTVRIPNASGGTTDILAAASDPNAAPGVVNGQTVRVTKGTSPYVQLRIYELRHGSHQKFLFQIVNYAVRSAQLVWDATTTNAIALTNALTAGHYADMVTNLQAAFDALALGTFVVADLTSIPVWDAVTNYAAGDVVQYNGLLNAGAGQGMWAANAASLNKVPGTDPEWTLLTRDTTTIGVAFPMLFTVEFTSDTAAHTLVVSPESVANLYGTASYTFQYDNNMQFVAPDIGGSGSSSGLAGKIVVPTQSGGVTWADGPGAQIFTANADDILEAGRRYMARAVSGGGYVVGSAGSNTVQNFYVTTNLFATNLYTTNIYNTYFESIQSVINILTITQFFNIDQVVITGTPTYTSYVSQDPVTKVCELIDFQTGSGGGATSTITLPVAATVKIFLSAKASGGSGTATVSVDGANQADPITVTDGNTGASFWAVGLAAGAHTITTVLTGSITSVHLLCDAQVTTERTHYDLPPGTLVGATTCRVSTYCCATTSVPTDGPCGPCATAPINPKVTVAGVTGDAGANSTFTLSFYDQTPSDCGWQFGPVTIGGVSVYLRVYYYAAYIFFRVIDAGSGSTLVEMVGGDGVTPIDCLTTNSANTYSGYGAVGTADYSAATISIAPG